MIYFYLLKKLLFNLSTILIVFVFIVFCQELVLSKKDVFSDKLDLFIILKLVILSLPKTLEWLLALSGLLSVMILLSRLASDSQYVILRLAGLTKRALFTLLLVFSLIISIANFANVFWLKPIALSSIQNIITDSINNNLIENIQEGKLLPFAKDQVVYVGSKNNNELEDVFVAKVKDNLLSIMFSQKANWHKDEVTNIVFDNGLKIDLGTKQISEVRFKEYGKKINNQTKTYQTDYDLQLSGTEGFWNYAVVLITLFMPFISPLFINFKVRVAESANYLWAIIFFLSNISFFIFFKRMVASAVFSASLGICILLIIYLVLTAVSIARTK